jgi:hypothetical protein
LSTVSFDVFAFAVLVHAVSAQASGLTFMPHSSLLRPEGFMQMRRRAEQLVKPRGKACIISYDQPMQIILGKANEKLDFLIGLEKSNEGSSRCAHRMLAVSRTNEAKTNRPHAVAIL